MMFDPEVRACFLEKHGWKIVSPLGQDSSLRRYFRISGNSQNGVLMESVPDSSPHAMTGHKMGDFLRIADWLRSVGLSAPEILAQDLAHGYLILEDFGDVSFGNLLSRHSREGGNPEQIYERGAEVLDHLASQKNLPDLPRYYDSHVHTRHCYVLEYYVPFLTSFPPRVEARGRLRRESMDPVFQRDDGEVVEYLRIWKVIEQSLPPCPQGFLHVDFHADNLMFLEGRTGLKQCGLLDFQGAMIGPVPYDLVNFLEDARRDVPEEIRTKILGRYDETFQRWYRVLGTQFHCRVIGQFIKLAGEGKTQYLAHIPRLENYIKTALHDPLLSPLKIFFDDIGVDFSGEEGLKQTLSLSS